MSSNLDATLTRLADVLSRYKESHEITDSRMAPMIGVTHPTLGRMLNPERAGAGGVAVRHWLKALEISGHLPRLVESFEEAAKARLGQDAGRFQPLNDPIDPVDPDGVVNNALQRIAHAMKVSLGPGAPVRSARELATNIGVTLPTVLNLLNPYGEHAGGTAIKHFVSATLSLRMHYALDRTLAVRGSKPAPRPKRKRAAARELEWELDMV